MKKKRLLAIFAASSLLLTGCTPQEAWTTVKDWSINAFYDVLDFLGIKKKNQEDPSDKDQKDPEEQEDTSEKFVNRKLLLENADAANPESAHLELYKDMYISLFSDDSIQIVIPFNNGYSCVFGTYTVSDNVATMTGEGMYSSFEEISQMYEQETTLDIVYSSETSRYTMTAGSGEQAISFTLKRTEETPVHVDTLGAPFLKYEKSKGDWQKVPMTYDAEQKVYSITMTLAENTEFYLNVGGSIGKRYFENYGEDDYAGGKLVEGSLDTASNKHYFKVAESGEYTITVPSSGYVYALHRTEVTYTLKFTTAQASWVMNDNPVFYVWAVDLENHCKWFVADVKEDANSNKYLELKISNLYFNAEIYRMDPDKEVVKPTPGSTEKGEPIFWNKTETVELNKLGGEIEIEFLG